MSDNMVWYCHSSNEVEVNIMRFVSMRDFRTQTTEIWNNLTDGEEIVITSNGRPRAFLVNIPDGFFDEMLMGIREAKTQIKPGFRRQIGYGQKHARHDSGLTPEEKMAAMQEIRNLLIDVDGNNIDLKQIQAERRAAKYERNA
jgi:antitoxin (DNA-binding transcriptional repressor) of toxin-antitoxin stability system